MNTHDNATHLYCMIQDTTTGQWFGLNRMYGLLVERGSSSSGYQILARCDAVETDDEFFPSREDQAPKWAWFVKASFPNTRWVATFFKGRYGAAIGNIALAYAGEIDLKKNSYLAT